MVALFRLLLQGEACALVHLAVTPINGKIDTMKVKVAKVVEVLRPVTVLATRISEYVNRLIS